MTRDRDARAASAFMRRHARSFALPAALLPREQGRAVVRLYGLCRRIDDLVDLDRSEGAIGRLIELRREIEEGGGRSDLACAFEETLGHCAPARRAMADLVEGLLGDRGEVRIETTGQLVDYCYGVAGTVGVMMAELLGATDPRALPHAVDLGIAMQLTNIARDVMEDARLGRRYLPGDLLPLSPAEIAAADPRTAARVAEATLAVLALAEPRYASGRAGLAYLPPRARLSAAIAAATYRAIGQRLRARGADPRAPRCAVPPARRAAIALRAGLTLPWGAAAHAQPPGALARGRPDAPDDPAGCAPPRPAQRGWATAADS